jgi:hypothetical protein
VLSGPQDGVAENIGGDLPKIGSDGRGRAPYGELAPARDVTPGPVLNIFP